MPLPVELIDGPQRLLVCSPEPALAARLAELLADGWEVEHAGDAFAIGLALGRAPAVALVDLRLGRALAARVAGALPERTELLALATEDDPTLPPGMETARSWQMPVDVALLAEGITHLHEGD